MSNECDGDVSDTSSNILSNIYNVNGNIIDLASPVLYSDRKEPDFLTPEPPALKATGRKRIYKDKYQSVEGSLRKQLKLDTGVHLRWQKLRGALSHNEFAEVLMDIYESYTAEEKKSLSDDSHERHLV